MNPRNSSLSFFQHLYRILSRKHNRLDLPNTLRLDLFHITKPPYGSFRFHMDRFFPRPRKPRHPGCVPIDKLLRANCRAAESRHRHPGAGDRCGHQLNLHICDFDVCLLLHKKRRQIFGEPNRGLAHWKAAA